MKEQRIKISVCHGCSKNPEEDQPAGWGYLRLSEKEGFEFDLCPDCIKTLEYGKGMEGSIFAFIKIID